MVKTKKQKTFRQLAYKPLLATALAFAGVFNMMSVVLAEGVAAGTGIENTATATYSDGTNDFDAISNTVIVNVAEVAGLFVDSSGFNDVNGGSIVNGDQLTFDFTVTSTGNADTYVYVPGANDIATNGGNITAVQIIDPATGDVLASVDPDGSVTSSLGPNGALPGMPAVNGNVGAIAPDTNFTVRVTVDVTATTAGDPINVRFGNTTDSTAGSTDNNQDNISDASEDNGVTPTPNDDDVRTVNIGGTDAPANGEREAADFREEIYATAVDSELAQALILKTSSANNSGTTTNVTDDTISYSLSLEIDDNNYPASNIVAGSLAGTDILVNRGSGAASENRILVSDAVPVGTVYSAGSATSPGPNWEVVYSTNDPTVAPNNNPLQVTWSTTEPTDPATVKRVGFIYNATTNLALSPATVVTGFNFTVVAANVTVADVGGVDTATVANIAQVFGQTEGAPNNNIVYDESGDQDFNNYDPGVTPVNTLTTFDPVNDDGVANLADPEQTPNANDGNTPDGESNVVTLTQNAAPPPSGALINGPNGTPSAFGPEDSNDDFTNVSTTVSTIGEPGSTVGDPDTITITNQLQNTAATPLDTVTLLPLTEAEARSGADELDDGDPTNNSAGTYGPTLPDGTTVKIEYGGQSATYTVTSGAYSLTGGSTVIIPRVSAGNVETYTVEIDLPASTPQVASYEVPIVAFVDNDGNGLFTPDSTPAGAGGTDETIANITINRVYTGFMELAKQVSTDGTTFVNGPVDVQPGEDIFYRITSTNISEDGTEGSGNTNGSILLNASNFTLVEDGNAGGNNWATTTLHKTGTTASAGTIEYFNGTTSLGNGVQASETIAPSLVTVYKNEAGTVAPQQAVTLDFTRTVQ